MGNSVHISVKAEPIFDLLGFQITNSILLSWVSIFVFFLIAVYFSRSMSQKNKPYLFYFLQSFFTYIHSVIESVLHEKVAIFYPLLGAYFFYILMNNWMGILPTVGSVLAKPSIVKSIESSEMDKSVATELVEKTGEEGTHDAKVPLFRSGNADINATLALALVTVFFIQYYGFKYNGVKYLKKFFNISSPIMAFVGLLEIVSEFARILSFSFRLFGNILAGEILITIVAALLPSIASFILVPFFTLEIMAGIIQAFVFMMISAVLIGMATQKAHH